MKIIIAGAGKIGRSVAEILADEGHDITVIDKNPDTVKLLSNTLDVICVEGNATNPETLLEAGADHADLLMAATEHDEVNMVCGISARKLGTKNLIARIRDPEYLSQTAFLREALGLNVIVNPEYECAMEISRILRFPSAVRVDTFSKGNLEIAEYKVSGGSKLDGIKLRDMTAKLGKAKILVGAVQRGKELIIPNGDFTISRGDKLSITGTAGDLRHFFIAAGQYHRPVHHVMIMGGCRIAIYLAKMLSGWGMDITVIERDRERCDLLCDLLPSAHIVCGDATRSDVLIEEGILKTDAFVALTGDDGDNIITSMYVKSCEVGKIVAKVNRAHFSDILEQTGIDSIVTPKEIVAQQLARYVRAMSSSIGSSMETLYRIADNRAEALEFKVRESAKCTGTPLRDLKLRPNIIISSIIRGEKCIIPDGSTEILPGDHAVVIVEADSRLSDIDGILEAER